MSIQYDTLEYPIGTTERSFGNWKIELSSAISRLGNAKPDTFTCEIPVADISANPIFPYEAQIILRTNRDSADGSDNSFSNGTVEFVGKRTANVMRAVGDRQFATFEFQGPWYDLSISQYMQEFKGAAAGYKFAEVVLNTAASPAFTGAGIRYISVGDQLQAILQFVLDSYAAQSLTAPFQYVGRDLTAGAIDLNTTGTATRGINTDEQGNAYNKHVNAGTTIDSDLFKLFLKSEIIRPMSAAETIQKMLDSSPRTVVAFDYTTTDGSGNPLPTIHIANVDNLSAATLALFDGTPGVGGHKSLNLQRRDDLVPTAVIIVYRITSTIGGVTQIDYVVDKWGAHGSNNASDPNSGPGVIAQILDLQGFNESFVSAELDCEALADRGGTHDQRRAWWADRRGGELAKLEDYRARFQDKTGAATTLPNAKRYYTEAGFDSVGAAVTKGQEFTSADYSFYTYRAVGGTVHSWMTTGGVPVKSVRAKIVAPMEFQEYDCDSAKLTTAAKETDQVGTKGPHHSANDQQHCNIVLTNAPSGAYSTTASVLAGESYIIGAGGIAQYLYVMLSTLQYEGEYVKVKAAFDSGVSLLNRANFSGGRAEWTTIKAQIQDIEKNWGTKETSVRIGVSKHLSAAQLSAFLNMWRFRRPWINPAIKADNTVSSGTEVEMPQATGQSNTVEGLSLPASQSFTDYNTLPSGTTPGVLNAIARINPADITAIHALN